MTVKQSIIKYLLFSTLFILVSCEEYFEPEIENVSGALVVEGILTDQNETLTVKVSRTVSFSDGSSYAGESNAVVTLHSESGETWNFSERQSGYYYSNTTIPTETGEGYYLSINTEDGETYESEIEIMQEPDGIAEVAFEDSTYREISYDYSGSPYVTKFDGIYVSVLPEIPTNSNVGFIYQWTSLINYQVVSSTPMHLYNYYCWEHWSSNNIYIYDYNDDNSGYQLKLDDIHFMSYYNIYPSKVDSAQFEGTVLSTSATSFYYLLEQYTITENGAIFWKEIKSQTEAEGKLFDPIEEDISSNICCTSNPDIECYGFFNTAAYSNRVIIVDIGYRNIETYEYTDIFPTPSEDEGCSLTNKPDFWIF